MPTDLFSPNDLILESDPEPRILDLLVAKKLGFQRPRAIRQIIERHRPELERYGSIATRRGAYRGHEFTEYHLNEGQALLVCVLSQTPKAAEVRHALIDVFMAWRRGRLEQPAPEPAPRETVPAPRPRPLTRSDIKAINRFAWDLVCNTLKVHDIFHKTRDAMLREAEARLAAGMELDVDLLCRPPYASRPPRNRYLKSRS